MVLDVVLDVDLFEAPLILIVKIPFVGNWHAKGEGGPGLLKMQEFPIAGRFKRKEGIHQGPRFQSGLMNSKTTSKKTCATISDAQRDLSIWNGYCKKFDEYEYLSGYFEPL